MNSADFANMRRAMVESQLRTSGVTSPWVLAAMGSLPREDFVPETMREIAYMDRSIKLTDDKVLNPPMATALMLQAAEIMPDDLVLLVGPIGGYSEALLVQRAAKVDATMEIEGLSAGKYSVIYIDGAVEELPEKLIAAAQDGARIVTGLFDRGVTSLAFGIVRGGKVALRRFSDSEIAALPQFARKPEFVF